MPGLSAGLQDPVEAGWAAVLLSSSLAHSLLTAVLKGPAHGRAERPCPQWKGAPGWPSTHSGAFPEGAGLPRPLGMVGLAVGAPGQGPLLS